MYRNIDVMTEMRKLTDSKPVHAVVGVGVLASETLKDLPGRLARWGKENPVTALPSRATGYVHTARTTATDAVNTARTTATGAVNTARSNPTGAVKTARTTATGAVNAARSNATGAVQTARTRAADGYDTLAARGRKARNGQSHATRAKSTPAVEGKTAAEGKPAVNGKPKGKAPSRSSASQ